MDDCEHELSHPAFNLDDCDEEEENAEVSKRDINKDNTEAIRTLLQDYKDGLSGNVFDQLSHGVTTDVIEQIVTKLPEIFRATDILEKADIWSVQHATDIFDIITHVLDISTNVDEEYVYEDD
jgi:hypothetical protein